MREHADIVIVILSLAAFIWTLYRLLKAEGNSRMKYITPAIWLLCNAGVIVYCLHCPSRATEVHNPVKAAFSFVANVLAIITYVSMASICRYSDKCDEVIGEIKKFREVNTDGLFD